MNGLRCQTMAEISLVRVERGFRRIRFMECDEPWWCSLTCVCERCLDFDALITERQLHTAGRPLFPVLS